LIAAGLTLAGGSASAATTTLRDLADAQGRDIGFALTPSYLSEAAYKNIADTEYNLVVPENAMKWDTTEPTQGSFAFTGADTVATYAADTDKKLYGHTLVWHNQLPSWVSALDATALQSAMTNHITTEVAHFKGKVAAWDVVNEAFNDDGTRRTSVFETKLGDGYIASALTAAHAADPDAKLCLNDYNIEGVNAKSTAYYKLVKDLLAQGVPVGCVGFQSHFVLGGVPSDMQANLQRFADLGVDVRVTELDVRMTTPSDATKLATQASDYSKVFKACLAVTRCQGVTTWGLTDKYSWVPSVFSGYGAPLMWDENYAAKPAYEAAYEALGGTPPSSSPTTAPTTSPTTAGPTTAPAGKACTASYAVTSTWQGGFQGGVTVTAGNSAITAWTVTWTWPGTQAFSATWSATVTTSGSAITAKNASWNGSLAANANTTWGFTATGTSATPTATCTAS
jgi:endo-1,4-beta-xylanase